MKKFPKPWYRPARGVWFVTLDGHQYNLGPDQAAAFEKYKALLNKPRTAHPISISSDAVVAIIDKFLEWSQEHRAPETYEWYRYRLQHFVTSIDKTLTVAQLKHYHLDEWLGQHPGWSGGTKHGMARAVQRALRWATRKGYIERSPIDDYEKPRPGKRNVIITPERFDQILRLVRKQPFRDLLTITWETGCRPQESLVIEARHVDLTNARWVFPPDEAKGEQWPRIIYLTEKALEITKHLMKQHHRWPALSQYERQALDDGCGQLLFHGSPTSDGPRRTQASGYQTGRRCRAADDCFFEANRSIQWRRPEQNAEGT